MLVIGNVLLRQRPDLQRGATWNSVLAFKGATNPKAGEGHKDRVSLQTLTQCLMEIMGPQCECLAIVSVFSSASWGRIEEWLPALY